MKLARFDIETFLRDYWQQKPLLIRNPWAEWQNPLEPDELAGLACEPEVESRLVIGAQGSWAVEHGPLAEARFAALGQEPSTLLVQAVDHHVPEVAALMAPFRFIPNWRIDDVMVSYATDGGGVGPHFDQYDVFLIQGHGRRRWRVGQHCDADSPLLPHEDLRLLAEFEATDEWLLEPGDILYVPPGIAHDGVAVGDDCMTYSIGFRAPSWAELITEYSEWSASAIGDDHRYTDARLGRQDNPGEITSEALDKLQAMVIADLSNPEAFSRWFGGYSTTPKYPEIDWSPEEPVTIDQLRKALESGAVLVRNPASRFAFIRQDSNLVYLFVDGEFYCCEGSKASFAENLCASDRIKWTTNKRAVSLLLELINRGSIAFEDGE